MSWRHIVVTAGPTLLVVMVVATHFGGRESIPEALVAWGTILLAYVTYLAIKSNNEQAGIHRKDEENREKRNRQERQINEIIDWSMKVSTCGLTRDLSVRPEWLIGNRNGLDIQSKAVVAAHTINTITHYMLLEKHGKYISQIALAVRPDLGKAVNEVNEKISKQIVILAKEDLAPLLSANIKELDISIDKTVKLAVEAKMALMQD